MKREKEVKRLLKEIQKLKKLVDYDELTEIFNRRGFKKHLEPIFKEIQWNKKYPGRRLVEITNLSILFFDIDNFKKINDNYGHPVGDKVLKMVAKKIKERVRAIDLVGRYGGEEIVVALIGAQKLAAGIVAEDIRQKIAESKLRFKNKKVNITVSIGVIEFTRERGIEDLITKADKAMYQAKKLGKNRVFIAD